MVSYLFILGYLIIYLSLFDYFILGYFNSFILVAVAVHAKVVTFPLKKYYPSMFNT